MPGISGSQVVCRPGKRPPCYAMSWAPCSGHVFLHQRQQHPGWGALSDHQPHPIPSLAWPQTSLLQVRASAFWLLDVGNVQLLHSFQSYVPIGALENSPRLPYFLLVRLAGWSFAHVHVGLKGLNSGTKYVFGMGPSLPNAHTSCSLNAYTVIAHDPCPWPTALPPLEPRQERPRRCFPCVTLISPAPG